MFCYFMNMNKALENNVYFIVKYYHNNVEDRVKK